MKSSNSIFDVMPDFLRASRSGVDSPLTETRAIAIFYGELVKQGNHNDASVPQAIRLYLFRADIFGAGFRLQR